MHTSYRYCTYGHVIYGEQNFSYNQPLLFQREKSTPRSPRHVDMRLGYRSTQAHRVTIMLWSRNSFWRKHRDKPRTPSTPYLHEASSARSFDCLVDEYSPGLRRGANDQLACHFWFLLKDSLESFPSAPVFPASVQDVSAGFDKRLIIGARWNVPPSLLLSPIIRNRIRNERPDPLLCTVIRYYQISWYQTYAVHITTVNYVGNANAF